MGARAWDRERVLAHVDDLPSPGERFIARLIDEILIAGVGLAIVIPSLLGEYGPGEVLGFVVLFAGRFLYDVVCLAGWGATLGKRVRGLRVADLDSGARPGWIQSLSRGVLFYVGAWTWYGVMFTRTHRGFYDRAAATIVVYR